MITGQVLRQIERTIRQTERSMEHERTDVQAERGLSSARPGPDRSGTAALGKYSLLRQRYLEQNRPGLYMRLMLSGRADGAPAGDGTDGAEPSLQPDGPAVQASGPYRSVESGGPDGLGQADERPESAGRGDDPLGADLRLTDHAPAVEQLSFLIPFRNSANPVAGHDRSGEHPQDALRFFGFSGGDRRIPAVRRQHG